MLAIAIKGITVGLHFSVIVIHLLLAVIDELTLGLKKKYGWPMKTETSTYD